MRAAGGRRRDGSGAAGGASPDESAADRSPRPRGVDTWGVVLALVFLGVAVTGFTGTPVWALAGVAAKWLVAAGIAVVGVLLLATAGRARPPR